MISKHLLGWYSLNKRILPWRETKDPYKIWISEIMLQQTQVATVIPYYNRWIKRFPNALILSTTPYDEVLKFWEGLGYYSRCKNIYQTSQIIKNSFPDSYVELIPVKKPEKPKKKKNIIPGIQTKKVFNTVDYIN